MGRDAGQFLAGILIIAGLFVLVRPKSQGPGLVNAVAGGLHNLITAATGGGSFSGK